MHLVGSYTFCKKKPLATIRGRWRVNGKTDPKFKGRDAMDCINLAQDSNDAWSPIKSRKILINQLVGQRIKTTTYVLCYDKLHVSVCRTTFRLCNKKLTRKWNSGYYTYTSWDMSVLICQLTNWRKTLSHEVSNILSSLLCSKVL